jgi:hypothetical protein
LGQKVAVCSYTNVGADRIASVIAGMGVLLGSQHFHGTLHRFLLRHVVFPFGHLAGAETGPHVIEHSNRSIAYQGNHRRRIDVDAFRFRPDRSLTLKNRPKHLSGVSDEAILADIADEVRRQKRQLLRAGYVSFDDAMYLALVILQHRPEVARAVAGRFDEILLDEAQDTSELQLACLDELKATGALRSLVLVGDLEQSIFSFQGASADGCRRLADKQGLRAIELTQNHRCSQRICDVAVHFCDRAAADEAVGPNADCDIAPEVVLYPASDPPAVVEIFRQHLIEHGGDPMDAAVLARGGALVAELNADESSVAIDGRPERLGHAVAALRHGTLTRRQLGHVESIVSFAAWNEQVPARLEGAQRADLRSAAVYLLQNLPSLDDDLRTWIQSAASLLTEAAGRLADPPAHQGGRVLRSKAAQTGTPAREVFTPSRRELRAQTVHDIKGEDRDAVMVVIDRPRSRIHGPQATLWESALAGTAIDAKQAEEKRIAFVALTRAERICVVALPDDEHGRQAAGAFIVQGFRMAA